MIREATPGSLRSAAHRSVMPTEAEMHAWVVARYGEPRQRGWRAQLQAKSGYIPPEMWYRAVVDRLVTEHTNWIDVGGGKSVFPDSSELTRALAQRCQLLVGVDPSDNIELNEFVHERAKSAIEAYRTDRLFDLATFRMVVEHIGTPRVAIESLARLVRPGGHVVIYTPNRWSSSSVAASLVPQSLHAHFAGFLWRSKEDDVFPTAYRMNTRRQLRTLFREGGFREIAFARLDSCSITQRFRSVYPLELWTRRAFQRARLPYLESNLLGVYEKA